MTEEVDWPLVRIIHKNVYNKAVGLDVRSIKDFGELPQVGDTFTDLINDIQIEHRVVHRRYFVTEVFEPSYWVIETRPDDQPREADPIMIHSLLITDYLEARRKRREPDQELFKQLHGEPASGRKIKPKFRDPEPFAIGKRP